METLAQIDSEIAKCMDCMLCKNRTTTVPGEGPVDARIMFIGEAPGFNEDQQGRPFVGAAGRLLGEILGKVNFSRQQVYITNTVKCRPLNNRDPLPGEMAACRKYLDRQIRMVNPEIIVTLGRHSLGNLFPGETIGNARGKPRNLDGRIVVPIYHPAAALRQQRFRQTIEEDMIKVVQILDTKDSSMLDESSPNSQDNAPNQLSMF